MHAVSKSFDLGRLVATPGSLDAIAASGQTPGAFIERHRSGDWGDVCASDKRANEHALKDGSRLLSAYLTGNGTKIWVITEAEGDDGRRSATTILLPEDY